ncbi:MAG: peptidoglycan DD-metalloendopeptidase family protein [Gaiellaceae bacterium]
MARRGAICAVLVGALALVGQAQALPRSTVAALQVALHAKGLYRGDVSGVMSPRTVRAVKRLQRRAGLVPDGIVGPLTRPLLGRLGRPALGTRVLRLGDVGADVAALQFELSWHGFPCGRLDGVLGKRTQQSLRRFQRYLGVTADGRAGRRTLAGLRRASPRAPETVAWPLRAPIGDGFGPRGDRFHTGIDLLAAAGTAVAAVAPGRVVFAGWEGGYGQLVVIAHGAGLRSYYAHLSVIEAVPGERVRSGEEIGLVGMTGDATGPHLHFELRVRGAAVDPLPALR